MVVQGVNIEILPPEEEVKNLGHPITFKNAEQVELEHRIKCAWATFTNHRQELKSPKCPLRDGLKLFDEKKNITPLRFRNVDDDGRNEEEAPDNGTTDDEDDHTDK